ncbi:MAG: hypothetical protein EPO07_10315 [Verrucomicrobia bacterium]|nr:MAG: hypothetical protein EPO07_10315 [Verrucomicrobiota bacterium]
MSEPRAVNVFVAYDLREAAVRAQELCEQVDAANSTPLQLKLWHFDDILSPATHHAATADAEISKIVLIAWTQPEGIPASIIGWLEAWARSRAVTDAILAALPLETPTTPADFDSLTLALLQRIALENKLPFVDSRSHDLGLTLEDFSDELRLREQTLTPTLEHILTTAHYEPHGHWGIND